MKATEKTYKWRKLPKGLVNISVPTKIQAMMGGVSEARQDRNGKITLFYVDGTTESANCPDLELIEVECFFTLISIVQDKREKKGLPIA